MTNFTPIQAHDFFKNPRTDDPRWSDYVQTGAAIAIAKAKPSFIIMGMPDDEGVRRNHGRPGANQGPDTIRRAFYKLVPGVAHPPALYDLGNLKLSAHLIENHERTQSVASEVLRAHHKLLALGGGNDYALPFASAFLECYQKQNPVVINLDAHLDVRPSTEGSNSGTPFFELLEKYRRQIRFDFIELGIQRHATSLAHIAYAKRQKAKIYYFEDVNGRLLAVLKSLKLQRRPVCLCVDMDAFSAAFAPGVSAPNPFGLDPLELLRAMPYLAQKTNIRGVGIFETSPPYDEGTKTAQVAAVFMQAFLMHSEKVAK